MKKMLSLVMAITMCLSLAACSGGTTSQGESSQSPAASTPAASSSQGASSTPADAESDLAYVQDKGTLVVGITEFDPMDYQDADGNWIGRSCYDSPDIDGLVVFEGRGGEGQIVPVRITAVSDDGNLIGLEE